MSFNVQTLLSEKARKYGVSESSSTFQQAFLDALNYALNDIDERLGLTTAAVTSTVGTVALDEQGYRQIISMGIDVHLGDGGQWNVEGLANVLARYQDKLKYVHMNYLKTLDLGVKFGALED